jgi:hypothetical protein
VIRDSWLVTRTKVRAKDCHSEERGMTICLSQQGRMGPDQIPYSLIIDTHNNPTSINKQDK